MKLKIARILNDVTPKIRLLRAHLISGRFFLKMSAG